MEIRVEDIRAGRRGEAVWLLEHPPIYTFGSSARASDLLEPASLPVHKTGRGGKFTYHGPGQRVVYVMLDLTKRGRDIRAFVKCLEHWMIGALGELGLESHTCSDRIGVWVGSDPGNEKKIASLGVRVRKWVSFHGMSINVNPDLSHYEGIVACGLEGYAATSLLELGVQSSMSEVDRALMDTFGAAFGDSVCSRQANRQGRQFERREVEDSAQLR